MRSPWTFALATALLMIGAPVSMATAEPVATQASTPPVGINEAIESRLDDPDGLLGVLVAQMPDLRAGIEARLRLAVDSQGLMGLQDEAFRLGWEYGQRYIMRFADAADGEALLHFMTGMESILTKMHAVGPVQCFNWMFGGVPLDIEQSGITVDDVKSINEAMVEVIRTGAKGSPVPAGKGTAALVSQVATRAFVAAKGYESGWALLGNPHAAANDHDKAGICTDVKALYGEILALPKDQAVAVTRVLFASDTSSR